MVFYDFLKERPNAPVKIAATGADKDYTGVTIQKGNTELKEQINKALDELAKDGRLKEISLKYFGIDVSK